MSSNLDAHTYQEQQFPTLATEKPNAATTEIDRMTPIQIVQAMNAEDATVAEAVKLVLPQIALAIEAIATRLKHNGRLVYIGAGSSGRLGALDAYECPPTFNIAPERVIGCIAGGSFALTQAAESLEDSAEAGRTDVEQLGLNEADVLVGIAASGRTPYVLGAVAAAKERHAFTIGLVCNTNTPLSHEVDIVIAPIVGPEVIAGSTRLKAGTAQKLVLNMLSTGAMVLLGKTFGNLMVDVQTSNQKLRHRAVEIVHQATDLSIEEAEALLTAANGETRTAIVAGCLHLEPDVARERLAAHGGMLRAALEERF